jgi:hypothetical protein
LFWFLSFCSWSFCKFLIFFSISSFNHNLSMLFFSLWSLFFWFLIFFLTFLCIFFIGFQFHTFIQIYGLLFFLIWSSFFDLFCPYIKVNFPFNSTL